MNNRYFFNKLQNNFEIFQKQKIDEKITHEEFVKNLPEYIEEINSSFQTVINLIDAVAVSSQDEDLKNTIKNRIRKLYKRVQKIMELHQQEKESEEEDVNFGLTSNENDSESITEISSGAGGAVQGTPSENNSTIKSSSKYGSKKINVKRFKQ